MITEHDVNREFFSPPSTTSHLTLPTSDNSTGRVHDQLRHIHNHFRFANSLIRWCYFLPKIEGISLPGLTILKKLLYPARFQRKRRPSAHTVNQTHTVDETHTANQIHTVNSSLNFTSRAAELVAPGTKLDHHGTPHADDIYPRNTCGASSDPLGPDHPHNTRVFSPRLFNTHVLKRNRGLSKQNEAPNNNNNTDVFITNEHHLFNDSDSTEESPCPSRDEIKKSWLRDVLVGLSIGAMSVPQGMSYALLAGLPIQLGLYNNMIHPFVYFFFGSSRHAMTGASAVENLMIGESLNSLIGSQESALNRMNAAIILSFLSALCFLIYKVCRLAVIADLLADPVLSGFATASGFLVGTSQLKHAFGLKALKSEWAVPKAWFYIISNLYEISFPTFSLCVLSVLFLLLCKYLSVKSKMNVPGPLILLIVACVSAAHFELGSDVKLVGLIPDGLPSLSAMPAFTFVGDVSPPNKPLLRLLFIEAAKLSAVFFVIHISIAKSIALRKRYLLDVDRELIAFSATNLVGGFFQCYPACTSISRSSVAEGMGAVTGLQSLAAAVVVLTTLLFFTQRLSFLPMPCLAAIVLVNVASMMEFAELGRLWNLQKTAWEASRLGKGGSSPDLILWIIAFVTTLCLGATEGLLISITLSLVWIGKSILRPPFVELGRLPNTNIWRDKLRFSDGVYTHPYIAIFRIDAPVNFCNSSFLERHVREVIRTRFVAPSVAGALPENTNSTTVMDSFAHSATQSASLTHTHTHDNSERDIQNTHKIQTGFARDLPSHEAALLDSVAISPLVTDPYGAIDEEEVASAPMFHNFRQGHIFVSSSSVPSPSIPSPDMPSPIFPSSRTTAAYIELTNSLRSRTDLQLGDLQHSDEENVERASRARSICMSGDSEMFWSQDLESKSPRACNGSDSQCRRSPTRRPPLDESLCSNFSDVMTRESEQPHFGDPFHKRQRFAPAVFILDCSSINGLDVTAIAAIQRIVRNAAAHNVVVAFSNWKGPQRDFLWRAQFYKVVPPTRCFFSNYDAFVWAVALRSKAADSVPLLSTAPGSTCPGSQEAWSQDLELLRAPFSLTQVNDDTARLPQMQRFEWDGLSALVPNVKIVQEVALDGRRTDWQVAV